MKAPFVHGYSLEMQLFTVEDASGQLIATIPESVPEPDRLDAAMAIAQALNEAELARRAKAVTR